jgi:dTDP-4-amino-4,6-dideoxygalactose transaminase
MLIGSKLPPERTERTYFHSGRAAFSFLIGQVIRPQKVFLPTFTCWSLVSAMSRRFPGIELEFYPVDRDLTCRYPDKIRQHEALLFIHYFGHENTAELPPCDGTIIEDFSHSYMSQIPARGHYVFGSYRKIMKVADGGFLFGFFNPIYEPSKKLDSWLRYEAKDWKDIREAENMLDRDWTISDIGSQSLAVLFSANESLVRQRRQKNERFLFDNLQVGTPQVEFRKTECPLIHNRFLNSKAQRDSLRAFLAAHGVFTSIHWPTHELVHNSNADISETLWIEDHVISFPISHEYGQNDMEYVATCVRNWKLQEGAV